MAKKELERTPERYAFLTGDEDLVETLRRFADLVETLRRFAQSHNVDWLVATPAVEIGCPRCEDEEGNVDCPACCGTAKVSVEPGATDYVSLVPTNWLDPLLTGPHAVVGAPPLDGPAVERLLLGIRNRIVDAQLKEWHPLTLRADRPE